jgi:hypothetical protein
MILKAGMLAIATELNQFTDITNNSENTIKLVGIRTNVSPPRQILSGLLAG